jgi:nuclear pore complex protein Nup98-Nup96
LFGSTNAFGQNKATFGFGSTPSQTVLFGQQPQQQTGTSLFQSNTNNLFGSTAFGNQTTGTVIKFSPVTGTDTMQKNGVTQSISTKHHCITCMKEYENKSLEELRFEDYTCNRKGPQQQPGFGAAPFGTPTSSTTNSLFGQTDNKTGFGQPQGFGQTPSFGPSTVAFGVPNQTNTSNLFGKPTTFGTATSNASTFGFNPTSTSNPFSANQAQKPFSQPLFGTTTTQPQPAFGTGVFGQTNTPVSSTLDLFTFVLYDFSRILLRTCFKNLRRLQLDSTRDNRVSLLIRPAPLKLQICSKCLNLTPDSVFSDKQTRALQDLAKQVNQLLVRTLENSRQLLSRNRHNLRLAPI